MLKPVVAAACLCAAAVAEAEPDRLSGPEITQLVAGATVEIDTPLGTKLPIRYGTDGKVFGQARDLASYLGAASDTGRWWVTSDQLCHKWSRWFDSEPQCLRLKKEGRTIHWRSQDGNSGTAVIAVPARVQTAAVLPSPQVETKMHIGSPGLPLANPFTPAPPADTSAGADGPSKPSEQRPVEATGVETAIAHAPTPTESPPQEGPPPKPSLYVVANVERDDVLNVRSGPSAEFDVVGELQPGTHGVSLTGTCRSQWCPIEHESTRGWVNRMYLANHEPPSGRASAGDDLIAANSSHLRSGTLHDPSYAPRSCLTPSARALLERIEEKFGPVKLVSTCRPGATIAGSGRPSRHADRREDRHLIVDAMLQSADVVGDVAFVGRSGRQRWIDDTTVRSTRAGVGGVHRSRPSEIRHAFAAPDEGCLDLQKNGEPQGSTAFAWTFKDREHCSLPRHRGR